MVHRILAETARTRVEGAIRRPPYSMTAALMGSPFDHPLSSRLDENDTIFVLDRVLIPWENVFVYGDLEKGQYVLSKGQASCRVLRSKAAHGSR